MKKLILIFSLVAGLLLCITGCADTNYKKFTAEFFDVFDTITVVIGYEKSNEDFDKNFKVIYEEMERLHKLYDIYHSYDGINNIKTINDNAGIKPVKVEEDLIKLIELGKESYEDTDGAVNIALGPVLEIWHEYRSNSADDPDNAAIPTMDELEAAAEYTNIEDVIIDRTAGTVFLKHAEMSLDVGAIAKGYAVELAGERARQNGFISGIINAGGNIYAVGKPMDGREKWSVGVQNPFAADDGEQIIDTVYVNDVAVVSSGDYQRFYTVGGRRYHHIIDPSTLMPSDRYSGVTVIHPKSDIADMLSTPVFILPYEEGKRLVEEFGGEAIWVFKDKTYKATEGYKKISKLYGVTSQGS